ncbi:unnamed protein product, partial [Dibothriocephalus latus]
MTQHSGAGHADSHKSTRNSPSLHHPAVEHAMDVVGNDGRIVDFPSQADWIPDSQLKNVRHHPTYLPTAKQFLKHSFDSHAYCRYIPASRRSQSLWVQPFKFHATAIAGAAGAVQIAALNALKININDLLQVPFRDIAPDVCTSFRRSLNLLLDCLLLALCADLTTIQLLALQCLQGLFRLAAHFEEKQGAMKLFATTLVARGLAAEVREDQLMDDLISKIPKPRLDSAVPPEPCDPPKAEYEAAEGCSCKDDDDEEDASSTASPLCSEPEYPSNLLWSSKADQSEEKAEILLRTPRLTALCALLQLLLLDSNFNL